DYAVSPRGREPPVVGTERHAVQVLLMTAERDEFFSRHRVPDLGGGILARGGEAAAIVAEIQLVDFVSVPSKRVQQVPRLHIPNFDKLIPPAGSNLLTIVAPAHAPQGPRVTAEDEEELSGRRVPDPHFSGFPTQLEDLVRAEGGGELRAVRVE